MGGDEDAPPVTTHELEEEAGDVEMEDDDDDENLDDIEGDTAVRTHTRNPLPPPVLCLFDETPKFPPSLAVFVFFFFMGKPKRP